MTEQRNRENKDFVMYYRPFLDDLTKMAGENYTAFKLFQLIIKHMDGTNALVISMTALSEIMKMSRQTLSKAVKYLSDNGWLCVLKSGTSNVYIVNPDVAWTSYADQKATCKFNGSILVSASENAEYLKNRKATNHYKTVDTDFVREMAKKQEELEKMSKE